MATSYLEGGHRLHRRCECPQSWCCWWMLEGDRGCAWGSPKGQKTDRPTRRQTRYRSRPHHPYPPPPHHQTTTYKNPIRYIYYLKNYKPFHSKGRTHEKSSSKSSSIPLDLIEPGRNFIVLWLVSLCLGQQTVISVSAQINLHFHKGYKIKAREETIFSLRRNEKNASVVWRVLSFRECKHYWAIVIA